MNVKRNLLAVSLVAATCALGQHNALTTAEQASGYELLFDGTTGLSVKWFGVTGGSMTSYTGNNNPPASWIIATENDYKIIQVSSGSQGHLVTRDSTYQNFDLKVEWKVPSQGNSGIFIRFLKIASWAGASGPEAQVVAVDHSDGVQPLHRAGTNYDMFPLIAGRENWFGAIGTWNQFRIIAYNNRVAHYGNGRKLLEYDMSSTAYATAYAISKYRTFPRYRDVHAGSLYLQHHGETGIGYRDMRIKKLTATQDPWSVGSPYLNATGTGLIDSLSLDNNLYPVVTALAPRLNPSMGISLSHLKGGLSVHFTRQGDYTLDIHNFLGARTSRHYALGTDHFLLPQGLSIMPGLLIISNNGRKVHQSRINPQ